jgi:hypothetical protein
MRAIGLPVRCGLASLVVTFGSVASSCGGAGGAADPASDPVDEVSEHDGAFCPTGLPMARRETHGFGGDRRATTVPRLRRPQEAWICRYDARDVAPKGSNGAWLEWVRQGPPRRLDADELEAFSTAIEQLEPPTGGTVCTADLGPRYLVSYAFGNDLTGVVIDDYGCHEVRLTDDPFTTVPGDPSQPGTVSGVLSGPDRLLDELNAG